MTTFKTLFGIEKTQVKNTCILMPLVRKDILSWLGVKNLFKGKLYSSGNTRHFTTIHTGIGVALLGDAVLYLKDTPCKNTILFGSCGLVEEKSGMNIGSLVMPSMSYSLESFSDMLLEDKKDLKIFYPDKELLENIITLNQRYGLQKATCATIGSLKLEEDYTNLFRKKDVRIVDMESSALFSASRCINRKAIALFYITDIINKRPFYTNLTIKEKLALYSSIKSASQILCSFTEKNLTC